MATSALMPPPVPPTQNDNTVSEPSMTPTLPQHEVTADQRQAKRLSVNFPILLPNHHQAGSSRTLPSSPTLASHAAALADTTRSSPRHSPAPPLTPPNETVDFAHPPLDFLTLLASQERKVLELREELQKAEHELVTLKKQWSTHEGRRKRNEGRQVPTKMLPVSPKLLQDESKGDVDERKRAVMERLQNGSEQTSNGLGRKSSQRVFSSSKHTRALSLLAPVTARGADAFDATKSSTVRSLDSTHPLRRESADAVSVSPNVTADSLIPSTLQTFDQLGFGKTYKDLATAASRQSLPPQADLFMKHSKQMVDGVRDGLWTFFEDIRQATVGDEAINGVAKPRPSGPDKRALSQKASQKRAAGASKKGSVGKENKHGVLSAEGKETSFWKEFGVETPKQQRPAASRKHRNPAGADTPAADPKSSTDLSNPPDLLADLHDEIEEGWDTWESPISHPRGELEHQRAPKVRHEADVDVDGGDGDDDETTSTSIGSATTLAWPEINKLTPSRLTRRVSDLMKQWDESEGQEDGRQNEEDASVPTAVDLDQGHALSSLHA